MTIELTIVLSVLAAAVGVAGWLGRRDNKISGDSEWRGEVNAKLDVIIGMRKDIDDLQHQVSDQAAKIAENTNSIKSAHRRIDKMEQEKMNHEH